MKDYSAYVPSARRVSTLILALILLTFTVDLFPQETATTLKSEYVKGKGYGYIDTQTRKMVIKPQYDMAYEFHKGLAVVRFKNKDYTIINTKGKSVYPKSEERIGQYSDPEFFTYWDSKKRGLGALDYNMKQVIPAQYNKITVIGKVIIATTYGSEKTLFKDVSDIYNSRFELIVPQKVEGKIEETGPGYITNSLSGVRKGLITTEGKLIIPFDREDVAVLKDHGIVMAEYEPYSWQFYRLDGSLISDLKFESFRSDKSGYFWVRKDGKWGLFRERLLTQCLYDQAEQVDYADGTFILQKDNKYGVTDTTGTEIVPYRFDKVTRHDDQTFLVEQYKRYGLYNRSGKSIIACALDSIPMKPENGGIILADSWGRYGCIMVDGTQAVPFILNEDYVLADYRSASAYLKKVMEISPGHPELIYLNALGYCSNLSLDEAAAYISRLIAGYKDKRDAPDGIHYLMTKLYTDQDKIEEAAMSAFYAHPSVYGHRAYMYLADKLVQKENFSLARVHYNNAGIYMNKEEANAKDALVLEEMRKRGLLNEKPTIISGQPAKTAVADLPTTLMGFAREDRADYAGNYRWKRLFTYNEAVAGVPAGFRLPTREDWLKLIRHISDNERLSSGREHMAVYDIGLGWDTRYTEQGVLQDRQYTTRSKDTYGLGISPLRRYNDVVGMSDYYQRFDIIRYWIEPTTHEGRSVNCIEISHDGFEYLNASVGTACVRYVKK